MIIYRNYERTDNGVDGIFCDKSLYWLCKKDKNPEQIFHALSYDEIEKRRIIIN